AAVVFEASDHGRKRPPFKRPGAGGDPGDPESLRSDRLAPAGTRGAAASQRRMQLSGSAARAVLQGCAHRQAPDAGRAVFAHGLAEAFAGGAGDWAATVAAMVMTATDLSPALGYWRVMSKPGNPPVRYPNEYVWLVFVSALDVMLTWVVLSTGGGEV